MDLPNKFLQIDEEGYFLSDEKRLLDPDICGPALENLKLLENKVFQTQLGGTDCIVEAFDEPFVASQVVLENQKWLICLPYGPEFSFELKSLSLDEWDRFHGYCDNGIPFVFSRKAQSEFFNLLTEFDDDSITWNGETITIPSYWSDEAAVNSEKYWTDVYVTEKNPGWNLGEPAEALKDMLPRLKLPRSRILVLGCGEGHDAALFAREGHLVTAVDISPEAIARAKNNYSQYNSLQFFEHDLFQLPTQWRQTFDLVIEHTCYCAINPQRRPDLVKVWQQMLAPKGQLMGVFFAMDKRQAPPFGGTEWELRQRLQKNFDFLFWGRWRKSLPRRQGRELFVLAQKKALL